MDMQRVRDRVAALAPSAIIGALSVAAGAVFAAGWPLRSADLVTGGMPPPAVVLSAAACLILAGLAALATGRPAAAWRLISTISALLLIALGIAALAETAFGIDAGIDLPWLHRWLDDGNPVPGRMGALAGAGFAACGLVVLMLGRPTGRIGARALDLLAFVQLVVAIIALLSNWLDVDALYGWQEAAPVTVPVGIGLVLLSFGNWLRANAPDVERMRSRHEEWHITIVAGEILAVIALIAGLSGFAILQRSIEASYADSLDDNLTDRRRSFDNTIKEAMQTNGMVAARPVLARALVRYLATGDEQTRQAIQEVATGLLAFGYQHIGFQDANGHRIASAGESDARYNQTVRLAAANRVWLAWSERGFVLQQQLPIMLDGGVVGYVMTARYLLALTTAYHDVAHIGRTADTRICALLSSSNSCFPTALSPWSFSGGTSVAMREALRGAQGLIKITDYRGKQVLAAYGPIGTLGLGIVLKVDLDELYAPIRHELQVVAPVLLLLVAIGTLCLRTALMPLARRLRELATVDGLTGALNRRAFMRAADGELAVARRYGRPMSVMMIDADHFKKVNDTYGHDAGDAVLKALSATCRQQLRDVDLFGRLGGEEFAIALPETSLTAARVVAERVRQALAAAQVPTDGGILTFTVSVGVSALSTPADTMETLLREADAALYVAKNGGRNRVQLAGDDDQALAVAHVA